MFGNRKIVHPISESIAMKEPDRSIRSVASIHQEDRILNFQSNNLQNTTIGLPQSSYSASKQLSQASSSAIPEVDHTRSASSSTAALSFSSCSVDSHPNLQSPSTMTTSRHIPSELREDSHQESSATALDKHPSNLSFGDMYECEDLDVDDGHDGEAHFPLEESCRSPLSISPLPYPGKSPLKTPPSDISSGYSNPNLDATHLIPPTSANNSVATAESGFSSSRNHPVLYSAIGSLENPTNSYKKEWKSQRQFKKKNMLKQEFLSNRQEPSSRKNLGGKEKQTSLTPAENSKQSSLSATMTAYEAASMTPNTDNKTTSHRDSALSADTVTGTDLASVVDPPRSSLRSVSRFDEKKNQNNRSAATEVKKVTISLNENSRKSGRSKNRMKHVQEMFRPSSDAYTPRMGRRDLKYKPAQNRTPVQKMASPLGTLSRPNFRDALRRVAMIIRQHIVKIEGRFEKIGRHDDGLFSKEMKRNFSEEQFVTPKYKCTMVRVPMARPGMVFGIKKIYQDYKIPSEAEIYEFAHQLFKAVHLSSECSIVCLIYMERLMEQAKVPLMACTWRPIFMCGLLLASKVWQDLSSWNIEFASVYPQYSLDSINRLELLFLRMVKWDLYISSSLYAKYYFALRSLVEKQDFRQRYNRMVGGVDTVQASEARKIQERTTQVKEEALMQLSRSM